MNRTLSTIQWVFLLAGLALLAGAATLAIRTQAFLGQAEPARGRVIELRRSGDGDTYRPVVRFQLPSGEARTFSSSWASNPPAYQRGEEVTVYFDPTDPSDARIDGAFSLWGGPLILGALGAVFTLIGGGMLVGRRMGRRRAEALRLHGRRVLARFQGVERNGSLSVNGQHPWRIVCHWVDPSTGLLHLFRSENLWFDPTSHIRQAELTVFVDPRNPKRHHVDLGFLPRLAE